MRGAWLYGCLTLIAMFSGCLGGDDAPAPAGSEGASSGDDGVPGTENDTGDPAVTAPAIVSHPVDWAGQLGTGVSACEYETTQVCPSHDVAATENEVLVPVTSGILRSLELTLTWTAEHPIHEELTFEVMTMASECADCSSEVLRSITGPSPLVAALDNLDLQVFDGQTVHAYVYNDQLLYHEPPVVAQVRVEQPIAMVGNITLEAGLPPADPHAHH